MVKILIALILGICAIISPILSSNDSVIADSFKTNSIKSVQGNTNSSNVFTSMYNMYLFDVSANWQMVYNYYGTNSIRYIFDGIEPYNVNPTVGFNSGSHLYALDVSFSVPVQVNQYRGFSVIFGIYGDFMTINQVQIGLSDNNNELANYTFSSISSFDDQYYLYFTGAKSINVSFIRIWFTADLTGQPLSNNQFWQTYMYGQYDSVGGYKTGYDDGYADGFIDGYDDGYDSASSVVDVNSASYQAGYNQGSQDSSNLFELFSSAVSAPVNVLMNTFDFEIFGVNVSTFILSLLTLGFIVIIIRLII